jgi:hypothetical protein
LTEDITAALASAKLAIIAKSAVGNAIPLSFGSKARKRDRDRATGAIVELIDAPQPSLESRLGGMGGTGRSSYRLMGSVRRLGR